MATISADEVSASTDARTKPPFLRRARIRGYKSLTFCDVSLEPLTILVGRNASGKSNFLDALAFLRDIQTFGVNEAVKRHGGAEAILCRARPDRDVEFEIECDYGIAGEAELWHATYGMEIETVQKAFLKLQGAKIHFDNLRQSA